MTDNTILQLFIVVTDICFKVGILYCIHCQNKTIEAMKEKTFGKKK